MKFLHFITKPYSIGILEPLIREIEKSKAGENLVYVAENLKNLLPENLNYTTTINQACDFHPDILFAPGNIIHHKIPGLKVQVFHGLCEEKLGHYKINGLFDLYCTSGPLVTEKFQKLADKYKFFAIRETGWIKVDKLLKNYNRNEISEKLKLPENKKIVLYTPTFSPRFKSSDKILPQLHQLPHKDELWILKFHDLMDKRDIEKFKHLSSDNILVYEAADNTELLQLADVLISDTSSIVYEFMLLDKPVITIDASVRMDKGINITDISQLRNALDRSFSNPDEFHENRQKYLRQIHPYQDTNNATRVLQAAIEFHSLREQIKLKPKPLNLFRKYRINKKFGTKI
ncbi:MAG: CDP-glycerol glycerophosphotransferase family protein [Candidatus Marinimicrobia bacterium]|nr:CDP-glycerol glycerophosphotransferase family protein [Candidatus Neomarinimicrobiota bacterium]